jgi:hypothetical protein
MGRSREIATLEKGLCDGLLRAFWLPLSEQGISGSTVRGGLVTVGDHPRNLRFKQGNAPVKFGLRIWAEVFASKATRRVSTGAWAIGFFH